MLPMLSTRRGPILGKLATIQRPFLVAPLLFYDVRRPFSYDLQSLRHHFFYVLGLRGWLVLRPFPMVLEGVI